MVTRSRRRDLGSLKLKYSPPLRRAQVSGTFLRRLLRVAISIIFARRRGGRSSARQSKSCSPRLSVVWGGALGSRLKQPCVGPGSSELSLPASCLISDFVLGNDSA